MARRAKDTQTLDLFHIPEPVRATEGGLSFSIELRHLLSCILKECPYSRYQVAARMSEFLGAEVSKYQLDAWTAESREPWRFPFEYAPAFNAATESEQLTEWLATKGGGLILWGAEALDARLGKLQRMQDEIARQIRDVKRRARTARTMP